MVAPRGDELPLRRLTYDHDAGLAMRVVAGELEAADVDPTGDAGAAVRALAAALARFSNLLE